MPLSREMERVWTDTGQTDRAAECSVNRNKDRNIRNLPKKQQNTIV